MCLRISNRLWTEETCVCLSLSVIMYSVSDANNLIRFIKGNPKEGPDQGFPILFTAAPSGIFCDLAPRTIHNQEQAFKHL